MDYFIPFQFSCKEKSHRCLHYKNYLRSFTSLPRYNPSSPRTLPFLTCYNINCTFCFNVGFMACTEQSSPTPRLHVTQWCSILVLNTLPFHQFLALASFQVQWLAGPLSWLPVAAPPPFLLAASVKCKFQARHKIRA